jgi:aspartate carbamoyltransferase catalytic subunit
MTAVLTRPAAQRVAGTRHLLSSEDLDQAAVARLLELAASFEAVSEREVKKLPTLRGRTVLSVFFEASTRTAASFELAAKRLSADTISLKASGSSVEKGETLKDTLLTLDAYGPDVVVIRHAQVGAAALATRYTRAAVVNAGDGAHQHPTQSLLDLYTMRAALGRVEGVHVAIVGDVLHSRVARSNIQGFAMMGADVLLVGPPTLIPRGIEATGVSVSHEIGDIATADVVYVLRMQRELITCGDRLDELRPVLFRHPGLGAGAQHVVQCYRRLFCRFLTGDRWIDHRPDCAGSSAG